MNSFLQYPQYDKYFLIAFLFLLLTSIFYFSKISEEKKNKIYLTLFYLTILVFTFWSLFLSLAQYFVWKNHQFSKYLLPPYQKIDYYLSYAYFHFWRDFIFRLIGVLIIILLMNFLNFVFRRDIFYDDEKILVPYLSLFFRFPYNALFLAIGFFILFLLITIKTLAINIWTSDVQILHKRESFRQYWFYLALILFLLQPFILSNYEFLKYTP
jgi:hypothetical protein